MNSYNTGDHGTLTAKLVTFFSLMILELISSTICGFLITTHTGDVKYKSEIKFGDKM